MRVYFDASVIIAAILSPTGGSSMLLSLIKKRKLTGITSQTVLEEVFSKSGKIQMSHGELEDFIAKSGLIIRKGITLEEIQPFLNLIDKEDAHVVAGAVLTKSSYLVSLDKKHIVREDIQKRFLPLKIVFPKEMLKEASSK